MKRNYELNYNNIYRTCYSFLVFSGTIIAFFICILLDIGKYRIVSLLPVTYCLCYFACSRNRKYICNISLTVINISIFCRYILYPTIIAISVNKGMNYNFDISIVWLLVYELLGIFFVIFCYTPKLDVGKKSELNIDTSIGIPNFLLISSIIPLVIIFPSLLSKFSISSTVSKIVTVNSIVEIIFTMSIWVFFIYLMTILKSATEVKGIKTISFILVSAVVLYYILFNTINGQDVKRWQIVACGVGMLYISMRLFPKSRKLIYVCGIIGIGIGIFVGSFVKFGISISLENFIDNYFSLEHFTEYFGGMKNITIAFDAFQVNANSKGIESTLTDVFSGVPILSKMFDYDSYATAAIFQNYVGRSDIICPLTAQSIIHFGYIGMPIMAMLMTYLAISFNRALKKANNLYAEYVLVELIIFTSLFIELNTTIIMGKIWIRLMFLIIQQVDSRTRFRIRRKDV